MKQYTYPAVFYFDEEYNQYAVEFSDICIYAEGDTMEETYANAQEYLKKYLDCCDELGVEPNTPGTYNWVEKEHPNGKTMLVTVDYEPKHNVEKKQETFTNLNDNIVENLEEDMVSSIENELDNDNPILKEIIKERIDRQKKADDDDGDDDFSLPEIE